MALSVNGNQYESNLIRQPVSDSEKVGNVSVRPDRGAADGVRELPVGSRVAGEVIGADKDGVQIRLGDDTVIHAKLENGMKLPTHSVVTFEISQNNQSQLTLRPLFTNTAQASTVMQALNQAGMEVNDRTMEMVSRMIGEGMSINRNSLGNMYHILQENPTANVGDMVSLRALNLPVNEQTIAQFSDSREIDQMLTNTTQQLVDDIVSTYESIRSQEGEAAAENFLKQVESAIREENPNNSMAETNGQQTGSIADMLPTNTPTSTASTNPASTDATTTMQTPTMQTPEMTSQTPGEQTSTVSKLNETMPNAQTPNVSITSESTLNAQTMPAQQNITPQETTANAAGPLADSTVINAAATNHANMQTEGIPVNNNVPDNQATSGAQNGNADGADSVEQNATSGSVNENGSVENRTDEEGIRSRLNQLLHSKWSLSPQDMVNKSGEEIHRELNRVYRSMQDTAERLNKTLETMNRQDSPVARSTDALQNNVDFLQTMNQTYAYVQIPLKMAGQWKEGDLYVYSRKRNLADKDEELTAMLHLDMEHLGPVGVYVKLKENHVGTKFMLQDEATIDFIEKHIDLLNDRLAAKGYDVRTEAVKATNGYHVEDEIREDLGLVIPPQTVGNGYHQSFDIRA